MEVKFKGTCIFEGDPIDEVLGLNSNATDERLVEGVNRLAEVIKGAMK